MPGESPTVTDSAFEKSIDVYADVVIAKEKETYDNALESFEAHAESTRAKVREAMHTFYKEFSHGYSVLQDELLQMIKEGDDKAAPIEKYKAKLDKADILADGEKLAAYLAEGNTIYQLLGFSPDVLTKFYEVGCRLVQSERYEDARDGFNFLVTIAPFIGEAWLGLGYSYAQCKDLDSAFTACVKAVELIPNNADTYLVLSRVLIEMQEYDKAKQVSDIGIGFAEECSSEPWAEKLKEVMQEAKTQIDAMAQK